MAQPAADDLRASPVLSDPPAPSVPDDAHVTPLPPNRQPNDEAPLDSASTCGSRIAAGASLEEAALERAKKRYDLEDPSSRSWALHKKHVFIFSSAGKPIFSRYGDESKLAPLAGVLQALISFVSDSGDTLKLVTAGKHRAVFVMRGSIYMVAVCSSGETTAHLSRQLCFLHSQIISILTDKVEQVFMRNASYDLRGLLGGADRVLRSAIRSASSEPSMLLGAVPTLRMPPSTRAELGKLLGSIRPTELLFGAMLAYNHLISLVRPKRTPLHPQDLLLVMNTVASTASFREDESWLPICLPRFNASGFLYAHVSFVAPEICLVMLTPLPDGFAALSACRGQIVARLEQQDELHTALLRYIESPQYAVDELGVPEVRHCIYRLNGSASGLPQLTAPRTGSHAGPQSPYHSRASVKRLLRAYILAHTQVHAPAPPAKPLREYVQTTGSEMVVAWTTSEAELYVTFSPLVSKAVAVAACHKLQRRLKKDQASLFLLNPVYK